MSFDKDHALPKFQIGNNSTKLYIPQDGKEYAIAISDEHGEVPVNFKTFENGQYTLSVNFEGVEMAYLQLITGTETKTQKIVIKC